MKKYRVNVNGTQYDITLEVLEGEAAAAAPKAAPKHPTNNDTTTSKFASLNLQFGRNYDPTSK